MSESLEDKFLKAYEEHADAIFRHCYFRLSDRERAKELAQDTFLRGWEYVSRGDEVKSVKALLYRIANNLVTDEWRKKRPVSLDKLKEVEGFDPRLEEKLTPADLVDAKTLIAYLDRLEPPYRDALVMRFVDDLDIKEIAGILGESENTISVRVHRGLKRMKEIYGS